MSDPIEKNRIEELLASKGSRGHFLKGAAVAGATLGLGTTVASAAGLEKVMKAKMPESAQTILNIAATAEAAAVTALYHVHVAVGQGHLNVNGIGVPPKTLVAIVRAALREEQDHYAFLTGAGAKPLYHSFTFPMQIFERATETLKFFLTAETVFVAAYMAANREFSEGGMSTLAQ